MIERLYRNLTAILIVTFIFTTYGQSQNTTNPAFKPIQDNPNLSRVLLIGDSISIGYTLATREKLKEIANVHRIPENGGPTSRGIEKIDRWLGDGNWDVIHFNWGLHDIKYMDDGDRQISPEEYVKNLKLLIEKMKNTGAKLIWASTTPVPDGDLKPKRVPGDEVLYNKLAAQLMHENRIPINDLYSFAKERLDKIQRPENVHFTEEGSKALAEQVANAILTRLKH